MCIHRQNLLHTQQVCGSRKVRTIQMENSGIKLSVVVPAYNEEKCIYQNLLKTDTVLQTFCDSYEIICVNDGSSDNTKKEIERAQIGNNRITLVSYDENAGKGRAIKTGTLLAVGEYIAFLDADLDLSPMHLKDFLERIENSRANIVIGSKLHPKSKLDYPLTRKAMSWCYYVMLKILFRLNVRDTQTGIKLFEAPILKKVIKEVETQGFAYDIEILALANAYGARIVEMPITLKFTRENGFSRIKVKDIVRVFKDTFIIYGKVRKIKKEKTTFSEINR